MKRTIIAVLAIFAMAVLFPVNASAFGLAGKAKKKVSKSSIAKKVVAVVPSSSIAKKVEEVDVAKKADGVISIHRNGFKTVVETADGKKAYINAKAAEAAIAEARGEFRGSTRPQVTTVVGAVSTMIDKIKNSPAYKLEVLRKASAECAAKQKALEATAPAGLAVKKTEFTRIKAAISNLKTQSLKTDITNVLKYTPQEEAYLNALTPLVAECKAKLRAYAVYAHALKH